MVAKAELLGEVGEQDPPGEMVAVRPEVRQPAAAVRGTLWASGTVTVGSVPSAIQRRAVVTEMSSSAATRAASQRGSSSLPGSTSQPAAARVASMWAAREASGLALL